MRGNMQCVGPVAVLHLVLQQADIHSHLDPRRVGLQVFEEDIGHNAAAVEDLLLRRRIQPQVMKNAVLYEGIKDRLLRRGRGDHVDGLLPHRKLLRRQPLLRREPCDQPDGAPGSCPGLLVLRLCAVQGEPEDAAYRIRVQVLKREDFRTVHEDELFPRTLLFRVPVPLHQRLQEHLDVRVLRMLPHCVRDVLELGPDPPLLQIDEAGIRPDDPFQIVLPEVLHPLLGHVRHALRPSLAVAGVVAYDDLPEQLRRLYADLAVPVHEQFIEETQGLLLLGVAGIGIILPEHVQVGADVLPFFLTPGGLQQVAEAFLRIQTVHDVHVVLEGHMDQGLHRLGRRPEPGLGELLRRGRMAVQVHIHSVSPHIVLEVGQLGVDETVTAEFLRVHVLQLVQDDFEGILDGGDVCDLHPVGAPAGLHAEVGIDQAEGLGGQVVRLQVPGGMVGCDVPDPRKVMPVTPVRGVVVVHEGDLLIRLAAELAQVMGRGRSGDQCQVHGRPGGQKSPRHRHGDIMYARDVLERPELRDLPVQAHHLIDVLAAPVAEELLVLPVVLESPALFIIDESEIGQRLKGHRLPLPIEEKTHHMQIVHSPCPELPVLLCERLLRIQQAARELIGEGHPSFLRLPAQKKHGRAAHLKDPPAADALPDRKQGGQLRLPVLPVQEHLHRLPMQPGCLQELLRGQFPAEFHIDPVYFLFGHETSPWLLLRLLRIPLCSAPAYA